MIKYYITHTRFRIKILRFVFYWLHFCCFTFKNNFIINISQHIENPGIVKTVYSCIFRPIQSHSAIFSHVKAYWGTLKHTEAYLGIIEAHGAIIKNIWNSTWPLHVQLCPIQNPGLFRSWGIFKILPNM